MTMADLIALGAPKLPNGVFYRVRPADSLLRGLVFVELRQDRARFGSRRLRDVLVDPAEHASPEAALVWACGHLADRHAQHLRDWERRDAMARYFGDHR